MADVQERTPEEAANDLALICLTAVQARQPDAQLPFLEALLADLTEYRDDLVHQAASHHHSHQEM